MPFIIKEDLRFPIVKLPKGCAAMEGTIGVMIHHTLEKTSIKQKKRTCYLFLEGSSEGSKAFEYKIDRCIYCPCVWHRPCRHFIAESGECPEFDVR